ncbi:DUF1868 domain-containing protein [Actibacterium sp. 188UL27-1]|uniref:DUF1868 domain-containing protein n=1 Tax=Actibacterium sp. 188UL27-1 TaxID=2786961 RepID=UPI00195ECC82|nr:DUF1868 domain-containing protein [Actibacterium sp. 188UL27-1]MBM7067404.1 DUF1868 domain-containing protein [Actibacterium sp. 188UL27-1]
MSHIDDSRAFLTGAAQNSPHPTAVGQKFTPDGAVLPCPGNTTLAHIDPASPAHAALVRAQRALQAGPHANAFTFLPPASFHMTVFEGVIETTRLPDAWPRHLPTDTAIPDVTNDMLPRLQAVTVPQRLILRPTQIFGGFGVTLTGATEGDEAILRATRDIIADAVAIHRPSHGTYRFHITLGYLLRWLTPEEAAAVIALSADTFLALQADISTLTLGPIEFCTFKDMHHFEPLAYLTPG